MHGSESAKCPRLALGESHASHLVDLMAFALRKGYRAAALLMPLCLWRRNWP